MTQAFVDPEALREFAQKLRAFAELVENSMQFLGGRIAQLGETWQDQEYDTFKEHFGRTKVLLGRFYDEAQRTVPLLERDAEAAEEYLHEKGDL